MVAMDPARCFDWAKMKSFVKPSLNWLLVFVPMAIVLRIWPQFGNETALFICSCLAVVPLAGYMGRATEELAEHLGHGIGGLLNATFGNAAELIIALVALSKGLTGVVKASITGSIIGNILLVMGVSILAGGMKYREQRFNITAARTSTTTLTLAAVALAIPTVFHVTAAGHSGGWSQATEHKLSLAIAIVLFVTYACMLAFELITHRQLYAGEPGKKDEGQKEAGWLVGVPIVDSADCCDGSRRVDVRVSSRRGRSRASHPWTDRSLCRGHRHRSDRQRRRALNGSTDGVEKQNGPQRFDCRRIELADCAFCRAGAGFFFVSFRSADGPGIYIARGRGVDRRRAFDFSNQR